MKHNILVCNVFNSLYTASFVGSKNLETFIIKLLVIPGYCTVLVTPIVVGCFYFDKSHCLMYCIFRAKSHQPKNV